MMIGFFCFFPYCGLIVGWIVCLLFIHFVRKKKDTTNYSIEINHHQRGYFILYTMLLIIIKGNFNDNVPVAVFISIITGWNVVLYLFFLITNGFAHGEKTKKSSLPKWEKARHCFVIIYSVSLVVSTLLCVAIYLFAPE